MGRELRPCGTEAAYQRHRYNGEAPCAECVEAHRVQSLKDQKAMVARRREAGRVARMGGGRSERVFGAPEYQ